jgi:uncharacterized SAM-binding protein YcdF (DUF218 family)
MAHKKAGLVVAAVGLMGLTFFLAREPILSKVGDFLVVQDPIQFADVIHVIAGPDEYTDYAARLFQQGYGKKIFFTGGWCSIEKENHGDRGRERALSKGVPLRSIATDDSPVISTYGEVMRLKDFMGRSEEPIQSVAVVSDPYHMRRARWTYRHVLGDEVELRMAPIPFELSPYKKHWWTDRESRRMVKEEYVKIVYYYARYKFAWGWLKEWLASFDKD